MFRIIYCRFAGMALIAEWNPAVSDVIHPGKAGVSALSTKCNLDVTLCNLWVTGNLKVTQRLDMTDISSLIRMRNRFLALAAPSFLVWQAMQIMEIWLTPSALSFGIITLTVWPAASVSWPP